MKKAALHNLGCKVNAYETEAMQEMLEKAGYEIVTFKEGADLYAMYRLRKMISRKVLILSLVIIRSRI